jgi:hypothetical protein
VHPDPAFVAGVVLFVAEHITGAPLTEQLTDCVELYIPPSGVQDGVEAVGVPLDWYAPASQFPLVGRAAPLLVLPLPKEVGALTQTSGTVTHQVDVRLRAAPIAVDPEPSV